MSLDSLYTNQNGWLRGRQYEDYLCNTFDTLRLWTAKCIAEIMEENSTKRVMLTGRVENELETAARAKFHFIVMHTGVLCSTSRILNHHYRLPRENNDHDRLVITRNTEVFPTQ